MGRRPTDHAVVNLAELHRAVVRGTSGGRIIWQPRILAWLADKAFAGEPLPEPYTGMTAPELYRALGCSNRIYEFGECFVSHEDERVRIARESYEEESSWGASGSAKSVRNGGL